MSLDKDRWGSAVSVKVRSEATAQGITDSAKITNAQLDLIWKAICGEHKIEFNSNADIDLAAADVSTDVPALGLLDSIPLPVTGQATGTNQAVTLTQKIK